MKACAALSLALSDQHPRLADGAVARRWAGRPRWTTFRTPNWIAWPSWVSTGSGSSASGRPARQRSESRAAIPSGGASSRRRCRTCARKTSPARASRSPATRCITNLGGDAALARLRERLRKRGLKLMLDFVPNHMGLDHPWVEDHPDYFIHGHRARPGQRSAELHPGQTPGGRSDPGLRPRSVLLRLARHAAAQLANPATQEAMIGELLRIAGQCDGVRCDMAMLVLPDVFERTWGQPGAAVLADGDPAGARTRSRLPLHGRGLLGPGMDAAAAGLRLRLRQAALRSPARGPCPAGARAFPRRPRLPGQARPLPGEPRRAAGGSDVLSGSPPGRGGHHVPVARPAFLPPGPVRGPEEADLAPPCPRAEGARR